MTIMPATRIIRAVALALLFAPIGCSNMAKPGPQSVAGMSPDGTVSMTEIMAAGAEGGKGTLSFQGRSYPFKLVGGVTGGIGAANTQATGEVYNVTGAKPRANLVIVHTVPQSDAKKWRNSVPLIPISSVCCTCVPGLLPRLPSNPPTGIRSYPTQWAAYWDTL